MDINHLMPELTRLRQEDEDVEITATTDWTDNISCAVGKAKKHDYIKQMLPTVTRKWCWNIQHMWLLMRRIRGKNSGNPAFAHPNSCPVIYNHNGLPGYKQKNNKRPAGHHNPPPRLRDRNFTGCMLHWSLTFCSTIIIHLSRILCI